MHIDQALSLMVISLAAVLLPNLASRMKVPAVVAEILFGLLIGKSLLNIPISDEWISILAEIGFLLLMFLAGAEINFSVLEKQKSSNYIFLGALFLSTFILSLVCAIFMGRGVFLALILSTTSLGLVFPVLSDSGITKTLYGQNILLSAILADFATFFGLTFYLLFTKYGLSWRLFLPIPVFIFFTIFLWAGRFWVWWNPAKARVLLGDSGSTELGVRFSIALLFIFVALSGIAGLEPVLGAFMGGCILSFLFREKEKLDEKLASIAYGFLIPVFFIRVGIQMNITSIFNPEGLLFLTKLLGAALIVKILPSLLLIFKRVPFRYSLAAGVLLSSRLSLIIAVAAIGLREGFINHATAESIIFLALVTSVLGPTAFKRLVPKE